MLKTFSPLSTGFPLHPICLARRKASARNLSVPYSTGFPLHHGWTFVRLEFGEDFQPPTQRGFLCTPPSDCYRMAGMTSINFDPLPRNHSERLTLLAPSFFITRPRSHFANRFLHQNPADLRRCLSNLELTVAEHSSLADVDYRAQYK